MDTQPIRTLYCSRFIHDVIIITNRGMPHFFIMRLRYPDKTDNVDYVIRIDVSLIQAYMYIINVLTNTS